jgi:flagellar biosynthetic protein FliP
MNKFMGMMAFLAAGFMPQFAIAESISVDLGTGGSFTSTIVQMLAIVTVLSLAPSILIMVTSFTRIIVVLSMLRSAIGLQQSPPNTVMVSLALFLTAFIMQPVFTVAYNEGIKPLMEEQIDEQEAFVKVAAPFRTFMLANTRQKDLKLFMDMADIEQYDKPEDTELRVLIPAFMISELKRAFEIGFLIFIPFLIIDMLVASILMAMGMMMLPPVIVSLPFKIIFFVMIDGWFLIAGSLVQGYN